MQTNVQYCLSADNNSLFSFFRSNCNSETVQTQFHLYCGFFTMMPFIHEIVIDGLCIRHLCQKEIGICGYTSLQIGNSLKAAIILPRS